MQDGSGKETEIQLKQNKVYGNKGRQWKGRMYFRTSESREHLKNQEIQILRSYNKWIGKSKWALWRIKTEMWDSKWGNRDSKIKESSWEGGDKNNENFLKLASCKH